MVELLDRPDEADRPLLDQVEQRQALVAVVLGDRDDEAQVGGDHPLLGLLVAPLDPLGQLDLLLGAQQWEPADVLEQELERVGARRRDPAGRPAAARPRDGGRRRRLRVPGLGLGLRLVEVVELGEVGPAGMT